MPDVQAMVKTYCSPTLNCRTREQAALFLMGHAWQGNAAANELLIALFSDSCSDRGSVPPYTGEEETGTVVPRRTRPAVRLFLHTMVVFDSVRQRFHRIVRG
jgi:hypothetical protein